MPWNTSKSESSFQDKQIINYLYKIGFIQGKQMALKVTVNFTQRTTV